MLSFIVFAALAIFAAFVAVETAGILAGRETPIGPIDFPSAWQTIDTWNPGDGLRAFIFAGVALVGLTIVVFELRRSNGHTTVTIAEPEGGTVVLDGPSVRRFLKERLQEGDWVRKSSPRVRFSGSRALLRDRPTPNRPYDPSDVARLKEQVEGDLRRIGLEPDRVDIDPRAPSGRARERVR
jgi:hypothetical protein